MPENNLYYIYIDSKIEGTIDQLMGYFQASIFHPDDCICICFKFYKDIEKYIHKRFKSTSIRYKFIRKNSDFSFQKNKVIFYLFNAQSNCRVVAHRDLVHVFVTHGESHKLASIKPIIRIYDFVITSGQVGVDRFLKAGIFNSFNIQNEQRVIPMGNTFIGQHSYYAEANSDAMLYAPTWEGGVPSENYCSIGTQATKKLTWLIQINKIKKLYIQVHPNLGHRDKRYLDYLKKMVKDLNKLDIAVILIKSNFRFFDRFNYFSCELQTSDDLKPIALRGAVVDISAMEMQLISEHIPTLVLYQEKQLDGLIIPKRIAHLYNAKNSLEAFNIDDTGFQARMKEILNHFDYLIDYQESHLEQKSFRERIHWLCHFATQKKIKLQRQLLSMY